MRMGNASVPFSPFPWGPIITGTAKIPMGRGPPSMAVFRLVVRKSLIRAPTPQLGVIRRSALQCVRGISNDAIHSCPFCTLHG